MGAGILILQPVGVGIGAEVCRRQCLQGIAAYGLPEAVFPRTAPPGKGAAIPEVQVIGAVHVDVADILCNIFDFRFMEQGREGVRCSGRQNLKAAPQGQSGMAVILRTLVAATVRAVVLQKAVEAVGRLFHGGFPLLLGGGQQKNGEQYVLGAPTRPVAHGLCAVAHPPEVAYKIGRQDADVQLPLHPRRDARRGSIQLIGQ